MAMRDESTTIAIMRGQDARRSSFRARRRRPIRSWVSAFLRAAKAGTPAAVTRKTRPIFPVINSESGRKTGVSQ